MPSLNKTLEMAESDTGLSVVIDSHGVQIDHLQDLTLDTFLIMANEYNDQVHHPDIHYYFFNEGLRADWDGFVVEDYRIVGIQGK